MGRVLARRSQLAGWLLLAVTATLIGFMSLRYLLGGAEMAPPDLRANFDLQPAVFMAHVVAGSIALLIAPWQVAGQVRRRRPGLHRALGRVYAAAVLVAGTAALPMALHSSAGPIAGAGFGALGVAWMACTGLGVQAARSGRMGEHRRWMLRSVALTFAAVTLRVYLPLPGLVGWDPVEGYKAIAWACWVPNLVLVETWLRRPGRAGHHAVGGLAARSMSP